MRRQVPQRVDVVPERPQVGPCGIGVVNIAQVPGFDQLLQPDDPGVKDKDVADHHDLVVRRGHFLQLLALGGGQGQRLFAQHVLAGLQGLLAQFVMQVGRGRDAHRVDVGVGQNILVVGGRLQPDVLLGELGQPVLIEIRAHEGIGIGKLGENPDMVGPPVAASDDADIDHG